MTKTSLLIPLATFILTYQLDRFVFTGFGQWTSEPLPTLKRGKNAFPKHIFSKMHQSTELTYSQTKCLSSSVDDPG